MKKELFEELLDMIIKNAKDGEKTIKKLMEKQNELIVIEEYGKKSAENFIKFLNDSEWTVNSECEAEKDYIEKNGKVIRELELIAIACKTSTIENQREDFAVFAKEIRNVANLMDELSETKNNTKEELKVKIESIKKLDKKTAKELLDLIEKIM